MIKNRPGRKARDLGGVLLPCILVFISFAIPCCQPKDKLNSAEERKVEDMLGRKVYVPQEINSVIGIGPGALRLLVYMQAQDMVTGVEEIERRSGRPYIFAYPELATKATIGPAFTGDAELIAARKPDVIFRTYTTRAEAAEMQRKTGVPVVAIEYVNQGSDWKMLAEALRTMGNILGRSDRAGSLIRFFRSAIDSLDRLTRNIPEEQKKRAYLGGLSHRGTHGINSTSPSYDPFRFVNARNVASTLKSRYARNEGVLLDIEQLMVWNPEVIFIDLAGLKLVKQDLNDHSQFFKHMYAFQQGEIYGLHPYNWYSTNFATVLANSWYVASILFPQRFQETDITARADSIYTKFLGKPIYEKMKEAYGGYGELLFMELLEQTKEHPVQKETIGL